MKKLSTTYKFELHEINNLAEAIDRELDKDTSSQVSFVYCIGLFEMTVIVDRMTLGSFYISIFANDGTDVIIDNIDTIYHMILEISTLKQKTF